MIQLQILTGQKAGARFTGAGFPLWIGRGAAVDVPLDEAGVWPRHCQITREAEGLLCQVEGNALVRINDEPVSRTILRNGDVLSIGAIQIRFGFSPVQQSSLRPREGVIWGALGAICISQAVIIYLLLQ